MGSVYLAEHVVLKKQRALKVLRPEWTQNQHIVHRFINEARAAASLEHRNIIAVHDFGKLGDGNAWFMIMDYLDGATLSQMMASHRAPPPLHVCLQVLAQIANGLSAAHRGGIIHRDLKPDNVFVVVRDPNPYHVVILDFGVAKLTEQLPSGAMTRTSAVVGTPAYTAAEQLRGGPVDARVDVFSLGVIAFQMVTGGWLPFQQTSSRSEYYELTAAELYHRQMTQDPTDPRKYAQALPDGWASAILSALHRDPDQRPADVGEFALALAHATVGNGFQPSGIAVVENYARELLQTGVSRTTIRAPSGSNPIISVGLSGSAHAASASLAAVAPTTPAGESALAASAAGGAKSHEPTAAASAAVSPVAATAAAPGGAIPSGAAAVTTPNYAARYKLGTKLGTGGMAEVFVATASGAEGFARTVAIKRVLPGLSELPAFAKMFVQEAQIACRLSHPNIVTVFDFDRDAEGRLFLAMEYVDGKDLASLLASGPVPAPAAIFLGLEILRGLGYAHDLPNLDGGPRGVVHRDVSPQNVLLSWEGAVKVSDFGLAKARDASAGGSGTVKGKVSWMSPEQANAEPLDGRSDLWAVGVMLWELIAGESLFRGTFMEVIAQVMNRTLTPPRGVPADLGAVIMKLLTRPRDSRYATAEDAILDLAACGDCPRDGRSELMRLLADRFPREAHTQIGAYTPRRIAARPSSPPPNTAADAASETVQRRPEPRRWVWPVMSGAAVAVAIASFAIVTQKPRANATASTDSADLSATALAEPTLDGPAHATADPATAPTPPAPVPLPPDAAPVPQDAPPAPGDVGPALRDAAPARVSASPAKKRDKRRDSQPDTTSKAVSRAKGELDVTVLRTYAEVYVDSVHIGTTPVHTKLPVGKHKITLVNPDLKLKTTVNVVITATEPVTIEKPW